MYRRESEVLRRERRQEYEKLKYLLEEEKKPVHIIGGGGVGMSALALWLHSQGYTLSASDAADSTYLKMLADEGIRTWTGSSPADVGNEAVVIYSSAIASDNPERVWAYEKALTQFSRHPLLTYLTESYHTVAVCGTHGKTTTSAWLAYLFEKAGFDFAALIGGTIKQWGRHYRLPAANSDNNKKKLLVIEADESDSSFLDIEAEIAVVTNIAMDHPDNFTTFSRVRAEFREFFERINAKGGSVVASLEAEKDVSDLLDKDSAKCLKKLKISKGSLKYNKEEIQPLLPGEHNLLNASALICTAEKFSIDEAVTREAVTSFQGVSRRLDLLGRATLRDKQVSLYDDYAHHPDEIRAGYIALKEKHDNVLIIWEPHRITRLVYFIKEFEQVLKEIGFNSVLMMPVFTAGDKPENFSQYHEIREKLEDSLGRVEIPADTGVINEAVQNLKGTDIAVVFMGAGESSHSAKKYAEIQKFT